MCGRLDYYLQAFTQLNPNKNRKIWTEQTNYCSPYKPFLLLSILDHINSGEITRNFIEPTFELTETFQRYIEILPPMPRKASMALPMYHLRSSDFWKLKPKTNNHQTHGSISSIHQFRDTFYGVELDKELFVLLQMPTSREKLREVLIQTYSAPEIQQLVREQSVINCQSSIYSDMLLKAVPPKTPKAAEIVAPYNQAEISTNQQEKVRDQGFRKAIVTLYDHRCALCGIKMRTPEGRTVVDAAHIKPWSESHNDHPTNGMALCKICHWSFDEGLMTVNNQYHVKISPDVMRDHNLPGHIMTLSDRPMFRPHESKYWPDLESFQWHEEKRFRNKR
jgi:putative restriction endonuclease